MAEKKIMTLAAQQHYDEKIKAYLASKDAEALVAAKAYADSLADNYDAAGTAATKVAELANGQVKANTDAISAINDADNGILAQAKAYADGKDEAITAAKKAGDDAQADVDAVEGRMDTAEGDIATLKGQVAALEAGTYDDTEVREMIQANADDIDALDGRMTTVEGQISTLVGEDAGKSARTIANEELAKQLIADGAKESLDTLAEIAAWIQEHPDDASAMNKAISDLTALVGVLPEGVTATTIVGYIQEVVAAEKARAEGVEAGLNTRLETVEGNIGEGNVDSRIEAAKNEAVSTASADATAKADKALADAKAYTDEKVGGVDLTGIATNANDIANLKARMETAEGDIDKLEASLAEGGATANAIAEAKAAGVQAQKEVDELEGVVSELSDKVDAHYDSMSTVGDRLTALEDKVGDGFVAITNTEIDAMFA